MYSSSPTSLVLHDLSNPVSKQQKSRGHCISPMISFIFVLMSCSISSSEMRLSNALYRLKFELLKGSP
jgi:hypothetical protein